MATTPDHGREPLRKIPVQPVPPMEGEIGSALRAARLKKGHLVDAVAQHTRIPKKYIEALEANRFEDFPAMVYLQSYLKEYSDYLELDFESLWKLIAPAGAAPPVEPAGKSPGPASPSRAPSSHSGEGKSVGGDAPGRTGWIVLGLLAAAAGGGFWLSSRGGGEPKARVPETSALPAAFAPIHGTTETVVGIHIGKAAYLRLSVDGDVRFEGIAPEGTRQEWRARRSVVFRTPNPHDITLTLNGGATAFPTAGPSGDYALELR